MDYSDFIKKYQGHSAEFLIYDLMKRVEALEERFEPEKQQKRIAELEKTNKELEQKIDNFGDKIYHQTRRNEELEQTVIRLKAKLEKAKEALSFYANERTWSPDLFLTGSEVMRSDLSETKWSRFTPGARARSTLKEIELSGGSGELGE